jgi:beta-galactosidase/beta-glucuronidase
MIFQNDELHPRPQMARPGWLNLDGQWQFAFDNNDVGLKQNWINRPEMFDQLINVPFPPESAASGIGDTSLHQVVWYRRTFQVNNEEAGRHWLLHFGAVDYQAQVWVNGYLIAQHEGGHTPFEADITSVLNTGSGSEQVLVVRAVDNPSDLTQPRGKQYWEEQPRRIWYHRTTGIWQPVWLETVGSIYVSEIRWTPDLNQGLLGMELRLNRTPSQPVRVNVQLTVDSVQLADDTYAIDGSHLRRAIALETHELTMSREQVLWSPEFPNLIQAVIRLEADGKVLDEVYSYAGLRSVGFANGRFLLNGRPYYIRSVLEQGYWPESHLAAPSEEALRLEVELTKELGFNSIRIHQKVEDPRFLYWCDRLGLMVWGEMANAYVFSAQAVERLTREWLEVIRRDYSHPSIVTWVPLNESWGVPGLEHDPAQQHYVRALYHLTHALDNTRPVIGNDGWEHLVSDVWGIHDYALDGNTIRERYSTPQAVEQTLREVQPHYRSIVLPDTRRDGEPIMLTECGGISFAPQQGTLWWGYLPVSDETSFLEKYDEVITAITDCPTISGFCYTQLTDTGQEVNGLLRADRSHKLDPQRVREITRRPSRALPGEVLDNVQTVSEVTSFQQGGS